MDVRKYVSRTGYRQCPKKSSYPVPAYGNLFWFLEILGKKTLKSSDDNPKANTSKQKASFMTHT